jgi:hypothetical protein
MTAWIATQVWSLYHLAEIGRETGPEEHPKQGRNTRNKAGTKEISKPEVPSEARMKAAAMRAVILLAVPLVLAGCSQKPSAGDRQKRYDELCVAVERAEAKQADLQRQAASYGRPKTDAEYNEWHADEQKQGQLVLRLRKERDEAQAALDAP